MTGTSGFKGSGITDPFLTPDAPTVDSVSAGVLSADVTISAPADTGGAAIDSYVVTAKQSDGTSVAETASAAGTVSVTLTAGGTTTFAAQALNKYGAGQFSGFGNSTSVFTGQEIYGWGYNVYGTVGDGTTIDRSTSTQIGALTTWLTGDSGAGYNVAIKTDGTFWSWGHNDQGQLGDNSRTNRSSPIQVGALTNWQEVSSGSDSSHSIKTDGTLWAVGRNLFGALGDGTGVSRSSPVQIGSDTDWAKVSDGRFHSLAIKADGSLYGWGQNGNGGVGDGTAINRSSPVQIGSDTDWSVLAGGYGHSLAVKTDGTLWAWGTGSSGELGLNISGASAYRSSPVQVGSDTDWANVSGGLGFSIAVKTDGTLWAWGNNGNGRLGINISETIDRSSPVQIGALTNWTLATAAGGGSSGAAIKTDGTLWTWGNNFRGMLGINTTTNMSSPVQISGSVPNWTKVAVFDNSMFAFSGVSS